MEIFNEKISILSSLKEDEYNTMDGECGWTETCSFHILPNIITRHTTNDGIKIQKCKECGYVGFHRARHMGGYNIRWVHFADGMLELWRDLEHEKQREKLLKLETNDNEDSTQRKRLKYN